MSMKAAENVYKILEITRLEHRFECQADLAAALKTASGNQSQASRRLGMSRATLYDRVQRHGLRAGRLAQPEEVVQVGARVARGAGAVDRLPLPA